MTRVRHRQTEAAGFGGRRPAVTWRFERATTGLVAMISPQLAGMLAVVSCRRGHVSTAPGLAVSSSRRGQWRTLLAIVASVLAWSGCCQPVPDPAPVLWIWERPEDLRELATGERLMFAPLVGTIWVDGDRVRSEPRRQPYRLPAAGQRIAVVRLEVDRNRPPVYSAGLRREVAATMLDWRDDDMVGLQVDFDALPSDRAFYRQLLVDLDAAMPDDVALSITAFASWCVGDRWLAGVPIDFAVPMLYRMGADAAAIRVRLAAGRDWEEPMCQQAYGVSSDEPVADGLRPGRQLWLFAAEAWTRAVYQSLRERTAAATAPN